jgi:hypothetical protein
MMHIPAKSEFRVLMEPHNGPCLSLFLPTDTAGMAGGLSLS